MKQKFKLLMITKFIAQFTKKIFITKKIKLLIVTKYVLKEFLITFLLAFSFFFVTFFLNFILVHIQELLKKSIPIDLIIKLMITYLPVILIYSLPFGIMLATLMTMGRYSSDNEIIAFRALGFNIMKIFFPIFICGIFITIITFIINDQIYPAAWNQRTIITNNIKKIKPTFNFKSKTVQKHIDITVYTDIVNSNSINGLLIIDRDENNDKRIITAKNADVFTSKEKEGIIELRMNNTMLQFNNQNRPNDFNFGYSDHLYYFINLIELSNEDRPSMAKTTVENLNDIKKYKVEYDAKKFKKKNTFIQLKEEIRKYKLSYQDYLNDNISYDMYLKKIKIIDKNITSDSEQDSLSKLKKEKIQNSSLNSNSLEFYRKFANPLACIIFVIFACPIGIYSRKSGYQIGFILGLFLTAFYWFTFMGSWTLGQRFIITPIVAMSIPNLIFLIFGLIFLIKRLKE